MRTTGLSRWERGTPAAANFEKSGWSVREWAAAVGCGRSYVYELLTGGRISSVRLGRRRLIVTPPAQFLAELAEQQAT
jgi:excisionase family DNA binding protein